MPVLGVEHSRLVMRIIEQTTQPVSASTSWVFVDLLSPIEPAGPTGQARVEFIKVIGRSNDEQAIVPFKPIQLVEEKRSVPIVD